MDDNVVPLIGVPKPEEEYKDSYLEVHFLDGEVETVRCDGFGIMEGLPGFMSVITDDTSIPAPFYNISQIKRLVIKTKDKITDRSIP